MTSPSSDPRITSISGRGITLRGDDIDTDQILPARYLKAISFHGMEAHVFADNRAAAQLMQRRHPFDDPRFAGSTMLLVNRNFGCGSSREHAPQGLRRFGIQAIIGESFGEIFAGNCVSVGMPCVQVTAATIAAIQHLNETKPQSRLILDLTTLTLAVGRQVFPVILAEGRRQQFIDGTWDPTSVLLRAGDAIEQLLAELTPALGARASG
jgi:3-isopropylmalate/(R)-2-methylmalate dehydratase small subunit